ncbi:hypothetical protein QN391_00565 [Pseudomonas sp. CCI1.2]|uniref:hypothetical protein n=1 Tax=unclassified Pseudomonas TaxID=196821 RepID=UPI002AC99924|nr:MULTISPECIES: hypothetical protein [unclassified Pseudomonas]MEB0091781.1 hypothetical protein [Pseudomonas sp. CCI4.2]MEB0119199.1 hypothetical protein [Pseudomonas sp. CCI1.2]WPX54866.1 hypothetical protein RHM65_04620 [Pseudomonas sp. CCI4.2]
MTNEVIFYTQVASIVAFIIALFTIYHRLVEQKDGVIQLLKERITEKDEKIADLKAQTPDALAAALNDRIKLTQDEIGRLKNDGDLHRKEVELKEEELRGIQDKLTTLSDLIQEGDLMCPECGAPLVKRHVYTIHGGPDGEYEDEVEYVEYQCGLAIDGLGFQKSHCRRLTA